MAITVSGLTVHTQSGLGTWQDIGGGQGSSDTTVSFFSGTSSRGRKFSGVRGMLYEVAAGGLDMTATVLQLRFQLVGGFAAALSAGGGIIRIEDTSGNTSDWYVAGSDTYKGGWAVVAASTSTTPSAVTGGGATLTSIRYVGFVFNASGGSGGDPNAYIDQVLSFPDSGLTVSGDTTALVADLLSWDAGSLYGVVDERSGIGFSIASLVLTPNATGISSTDEILVFEDLVYYDGTNTASSLELLELSCADADPVDLTRFSCSAFNNPDATGGNEAQRSLDFSGAGNVSVLDSTFSGFDATASPVVLGGSGNDYTNVSFLRCGQVTESGAVLRGCIFGNSVSSTGALLWSATMDIKDSSFRNNAADIEHDTAGTFTYDNLTTSGSTVQANNTSGGAVTVNAVNGTNFNQANSNLVTIVNSRAFTLTGLSNPTKVYLFDSTLPETDGAYQLDAQLVTTGTYSYSFSAGLNKTIIYRLVSLAQKIIEGEVLFNDDNVTIPISQSIDREYENS